MQVFSTTSAAISEAMPGAWLCPEHTEGERDSGANPAPQPPGGAAGRPPVHPILVPFMNQRELRKGRIAQR